MHMIKCVQGWPGHYNYMVHNSKQTSTLQLTVHTIYRIYAPYMTIYLVISLPKIPYIHRIHMVLANPKYVLMECKDTCIAGGRSRMGGPYCEEGGGRSGCISCGCVMVVQCSAGGGGGHLEVGGLIPRVLKN